METPKSSLIYLLNITAIFLYEYKKNLRFAYMY